MIVRVLKSTVIRGEVVTLRREADCGFLHAVHACAALQAGVVCSAALGSHLFDLKHDVALVLRFLLAYSVGATRAFLAVFAVVPI